MNTSKRIALVFLAASGLMVGAVMMSDQDAYTQESQVSTTKAGMRGIFITLTTAYGYSLDRSVFEDPANRREILGVLKALEANAAEIEKHGGGLDASYDYLRRSLARDARDVVQRYEQRQYMGARFVLNKITENCVSCHTKYPSDDQFDLGSKFLENSEIQKLPAVARVDIEIATRQFDTALNTYEEILNDPKATAENLSLLGVFEGYLRISVGALRNTERAIKAFSEFKKRDDMPGSLKGAVGKWIDRMQSLDLEAPKGSELKTARDLIDGARAGMRHPSDRSYLVDFVVATTIIHHFLKSEPKSDNAVAEAFYLLGVAESFIKRSYWISETEFLLEQAIRRAPKSSIAKDAFAFLEEYTLSGHMQTSAREVPPELRANLDELRLLIEN